MSLNTPVALIIFNRPDKTKRVLQAIAEARPRQLFVIADGPRADHPEDHEKCAAARALIEQVDWDCEVAKNYSDVNLGCGQRPATGIAWVFECAEEAIILEDDCLPHPTFFRFCSELLNKYRDDERVMMVGGFLLHENPAAASYYFSRLPANVGGWATWRRAWRHWDGAIKQWPTLRDTPWLRETLNHSKAAQQWRDIFDQAFADGGRADYWDYQWAFACWIRGGLCALPTRNNLISNIGFDADATHTKSVDCRANLPTTAMRFPLECPPDVAPDSQFDRIRLEKFFAPERPLVTARRRLRRVLKMIPGLRLKQLGGIER